MCGYIYLNAHWIWKAKKELNYLIKIFEYQAPVVPTT